MSLQATAPRLSPPAPSTMACPEQTVIELQIFWDNALLRIVHLQTTDAFILQSEGTYASNVLFVSATELPSFCTQWRLIKQTPKGPAVAVPAGTMYRVSTLGELAVLENIARKELTIPLHPTQTVECMMGGLRLQCALVNVEKSQLVRKPVDRVMTASTVGSAVVALLILAFCGVFATTRSSFVLGEWDETHLRHLVALTEHEPSEPPRPRAATRSREGTSPHALRFYQNSVADADSARSLQQPSSWGLFTRRPQAQAEPVSELGNEVERQPFRPLGNDGHASPSSQREAACGPNAMGAEIVMRVDRGVAGLQAWGDCDSVHSACGEFGPSLANPRAIQRTVMRNISRIQACYATSLEADSTVAGTVLVRFVLGTDGRVLGTNIVENSTGTSPIAHCVESEFRRLRFPPSANYAVVNYPVTFRTE